MPTFTSRPALRWLVPVAAAAAVIGGGAAIGALTAAADPSLPERSAAQLLVDLQTARLDGLSGTVVARADLGLPPLTGLGPPGGQNSANGGSADLATLASGTHTLRVWYSGPMKARVALLGTLGESDVITNGHDVWIWSSQENKATHRTVTAPAPGELSHPTGTMTPKQLASLALAAIDPTTKVTTDGSATVAGRDAYELVLAPRDVASRINSIRLAIDAAQHVPLRVQVYARGTDAPVIEVAFTQVSFARPDNAQFTFNPPPGTTVVEGNAPSPDAHSPGAPSTDPSAAGPAGMKTAIVGSGWTTVFVARVPTGSDNPFAALVKQLPAVSGSWGSGHLLTGKLFSALVTDDGRVLVGAVGPERLYTAAADPAAKL
jgi:outer membrane lipoprotein-sorting protein